MTFLNQTQCDAIGLTFILNKLAPNSPYGAQKIKQLTPFHRNNEASLHEQFDNLEKLKIILETNPAKLEEVCRLLMQLKNIRNVVAKCKTSNLNEVELFELKNFLLIFERLMMVWESVEGDISGISLEPMNVALDILDPEGKRLVPFALDQNFSEKLVAIRKEKRLLEKKIQFETDLIIRDELMKSRYQVVIAEVTEEEKIMGDLTKQLRNHIQTFYQNMEHVGKLDLLIAKAYLANEYGAIRPKLIKESTVVLTNMFNPYVAHTLQKKKLTFTNVSVSLIEGVTMITGANMGGKSVAIKTMVLNVALCQMGFFVFAKEAQIPLFDGIAYISGDLQDIDQGLSTFGAEINCLNEIVLGLKGAFHFVALDEFARGTNPVEGAAIVRAVASYLSNSGSVCVMTTHYDGVVSTKYKHYQVAGLDFSAIEKLRTCEFNGLKSIANYMDYTLLEVDANAPLPQEALNICKLINLDPDILNRIEREYTF